MATTVPSVTGKEKKPKAKKKKPKAKKKRQTKERKEATNKNTAAKKVLTRVLKNQKTGWSR